MPAIYIFVYYNAGLYADFGINIYYLGAAIYGWMMWKYGAFLRRTILKKTAANIENPQQKPPITRMPLHYLLPLTAVFAATFAGIAWILINFTDSNVPLLDSFTTALSIIGMWMLARKYVEQWWAWIGVDAVSAGLYVYKGFYRCIICPLHNNRYLWLLQMEEDDERMIKKQGDERRI